jgi:putative lipoic acid-binding regulatory protein
VGFDLDVHQQVVRRLTRAAAPRRRNDVQDTDAPKIEFPCDYPIKVLGRSSAEFKSVILEVFERHAPGFDSQTITVRASRKGTFTALTVTITATGTDQLEALHQDLLATGHVTMVI